MLRIQNFINGQLIDPASNEWIDNINPALGEVYGQIPNSQETDVNQAVIAANKAFSGWSNTSIEKRSECLLRIAKGIENRLEEFAQAESVDNGKPLNLARKVDIPRAIANFRFFAKAITQYASKSHQTVHTNSINFTLRKPVGIVGCISPWNLPLYLFSWKIAPALAAGNCVIAKPSEVTPVTAFLLSQVCQEADLPPGVLNIVHGSGEHCGQSIVAHPSIKAISFTGGTSTGQHIARTAAPMFKKLSLELGGKNPNLVFADCDYEKMLKTTLKSSFANQGQICLCGSRIYVEESIFNKFKNDFVAATKKLIVGDPNHPSTDLGALVSQAHLEKVYNYIKQINPAEAKILVGGNLVHPKGFEKGYFLEPTIIEVNNNQCRLNQEEIFGPVVTLMPFKTEKEALKLANEVRYGLSSTVWTNDINRSMRLSQEIEAGIVWVNTWLNRDLRTPFGGVKESGVGREGGFEALDFFTEPKNVCIQYQA